MAGCRVLREGGGIRCEWHHQKRQRIFQSETPAKWQDVLTMGKVIAKVFCA